MFKVVAVAVICAFVLVYLKSVNSDLFGVAALGAGVVVISFGVEYLYQTVTLLNSLFAISRLNEKYFSVVLKITGIAYVVEFGAGIVEDLGLKSIADKLVFVGKLAVLTAAAPIIYAVFNLVAGLLQ